MTNHHPHHRKSTNTVQHIQILILSYSKILLSILNYIKTTQPFISQLLLSTPHSRNKHSNQNTHQNQYRQVRKPVELKLILIRVGIYGEHLKWQPQYFKCRIHRFSYELVTAFSGETKPHKSLCINSLRPEFNERVLHTTVFKTSLVMPLPEETSARVSNDFPSKPQKVSPTSQHLLL